MGFSQDEGYTPATIEDILTDIMEGINDQFGTTYTYEQFVGTNFYKYFYALAQRVQQNEVKTSEIFVKLQQYFDVTNERISRPVVTNPGLVEALANYTSELIPDGLVASVKPMIEADAGKINICVQVDDGDHATGTVTITDYANLVSGTDDSITVGATAFTAQAGAATPGDATFQAATDNDTTAESLAAQINAHATAGALVKATVIDNVVTLRAIHGGTAGNSIALVYTDNDSNVGATVSGATLEDGTDNEDYEDIRAEICELIKDSTVAGAVTYGSESESIVLSNGQSFDFKYHLPNPITPLLKLTITLSENNQSVVKSPEDVKADLLLNIAARYRLGKNFEPQRYYSLSDAPWASDVLLEYSLDNGGSYTTDVYDANFDDLFVIDLANVTLIEA